jgi:DNA polymerase elongation subunit (family B)
MSLIFDIETMEWFKNDDHKKEILESRQDKRLKEPDKIAENHKKILSECALYPMSGQITIVGFRDTEEHETRIITNGYADVMDAEVVCCADEAGLVKVAWDLIVGAIDGGKRIVGFRSKDFDLPYLFTRALYHNLKPNVPYMSLIHPYTHDMHLDIKALFEKGSLRDITRFLDISTENETDGSELPELWKTNPGKVVEKCKSDLIRTENLYERIKQWIPQRLQIS